MLKIVIQNPSSETIINNVFPDQLPFWQELLKDAVKGEIHIIDLSVTDNASSQGQAA